MKLTKDHSINLPLLLERLSTPLLIVGANGIIDHANEAALQLMQLSADELLGRSWAGLDAHLTLIFWKKKWQELQQSHTLEYQTDLSTDGLQLLPIEVSMAQLDDTKALLTITDISSQQQRIAHLDCIGEQQQAGYWSYNIVRDQWAYSRTFNQLLELDEQATLTAPFIKLLSPYLSEDRIQQLDKEIANAIASGQSIEQELHLKKLTNKRLVLNIKVLQNDLHSTHLLGSLSQPDRKMAAPQQANNIAQFSLDYAREMILWTHQDGTIAYANRAFCQRMGYSFKELQNISSKVLTAEVERSKRESIWKKLMENGYYEGESRLLTKSGETFPTSYTTNLISFEDQTITCTNFIDITKRREREQRLELTQFTTDHAPTLIFWTNPEGEFLYGNLTACEKLGYSQEHFQGASITSVAPYFNEEARDAFWEELRSKKTFTKEYPLYAKNGTEVFISAAVNYLKFGDQEIACSFCRDITQVQKRQTRQRFMEFTLDITRDMILWVEFDGKIRYFNQTFLERSGYTEEQIYASKTRDFFPYATPERRKRLWEILRKDGHFEMETSLKMANGKDLPVKANFNYIQYEGEELNSVYFRDWTQKKERDLRLNLSNAALDNAAEAITWLEEDGTVRYLNNATLEYLGKDQKYWLGKKVGAVFPQLSLKEIKHGKTIEYHMPGPEGSSMYLELSFSEVVNDGQLFFMIIGRNFTERYLRRKQLEAANKRIEELSSRLQEENIILKEDIQSEYSIDNIITVSDSYKKILQQISQVAETNTTVLILGETGTGKELLARAVHSLSEREDYPLIKVNCAALPENLIESELFGHEKGAFTGAQEQKRGRFEMANKGTIFLDEVGELPLSLQAKLLRVLQEGEFERVGGTKTIKVDVRLIAATNRSLEEMVKAGEFRADLYYRLNVFPIVNIPLRERPEDIPVLAQFFARKFAQRQGKKINKINSKDLEKLKKYRFPGNVRELENIIERAVVFCKGETLNIDLQKSNAIDLNDQIFKTFDEMQREYIIQALQKTGGRITGPEGAGRLLGLNDRTLMSKIRKFDIQKREYIV